MMEKQVTDAVMFASLEEELADDTFAKTATHDEAASSPVPRWPMEMTLARESEYSASWVKKTGIVDLTSRGSSTVSAPRAEWTS
jgi:hypothetical protein